MSNLSPAVVFIALIAVLWLVRTGRMARIISELTS